LSRAAARRAIAALRATAFAAIALGASAPALVSCGGKLPRVAAVEWRLESRPGANGTAYESLSVFGSIKDEDGLDNIEEIWVVNDASALAWKLTNAEWTKASEGTEDWIGGSSLATAELAPLPRGDYRLVAIDASGQRAEMAFAVAGDFPDKKAPSVSYSIGDGSLAIRSDWTENLVLAFDAAGALLSSSAAPKKAAALADIFGYETAQRIALVGAYGFEPEIKMGAFSPRIKTR
jgi:hypothetical protein